MTPTPISSFAISSQLHLKTTQDQPKSNLEENSKTEQPKRKLTIVWKNVILFVYMHVAAVYGIYLWIFVCTWKTFFWAWLLGVVASQGITAGAHRLWTHRSYKAKIPLRIILMFLQTIAMQNDIHEWVRDHRVHHKFTDTDADPHNSKRGFFFSHMGWLLVKKHNDVITKGKTVDMSDVAADPVVRFQRQYYVPLALLCFLTSALVPWYLWGESWWTCWNVAGIGRYVLSLHLTWLVNSAAHIWGTKPYDRTIGPTENIYVAIAAFGEGWHNYHHVFPWDYRTAELGGGRYNPTTTFIDSFAKVGWAYDLKTVSMDVIEQRAKKTGNGSRMFKDVL